MRPQRPIFLLREAPDIDRVAVHVLTHWRLPSVDVRIDRLPLLDSQRMQDHFARAAAACNCVVGEALGGVTLLVGSCLACVWQSWRFLFLALAATLAVALVGKCAEVAWNRASLLLGLRRLRVRLSDALAGRLLDTSPVVIPEHKTYDYPVNSRNGDVAELPATVRTDVPRAAGRVKLVVRDASDIDAAIRHLFAHWALPRIVLDINGIPVQVLERAQDRLVRLSGGYGHQLAGMLAFATFVVGMTLIIRSPGDVMLWTMDQDWSDFLVVLVATFIAMLLGHLGEVAWVRVHLRRVLLHVQRQLPRPA